MKVKTLALTMLASFALTSGVIGVSQTTQVKAAGETNAKRLVETAYDYHLDGLGLGSASAQQVFDDGLYWLREDVDATVIDVNGEKALDLAIIGDDGGGSARIIGVGNGGNGLYKLAVGASYEISTYIDVSNIDPNSSVYYELSVQDQWTGVYIKNGVVNICDTAHVYNVSYKDNILKFSFHAREKANFEECRPYGKVTVTQANIGDNLIIGSFTAVETGVYAMDFEQFAVGTAAPANNDSSIPNIYNASMTTVDIKNDETHGHYLDVVYENTGTDPMWPAFYFNQFWNVISDQSYRLSIDVLANDSIELYFKYNDTNDGCYTLFPNGDISSASGPNEYITNPYWDGTHFEADILFSSNKNANFWQQFAIVFAAAGSKTTNLKFDNFELFPLSRTVTSISVNSTKTSFDCDEAYSSESVVVTAQRKDGTSFVLDKDLYTVDSSSYKSNTPGQYQVNISAVDSITNATLETSYNVTVNDKVDSIQIKTNPTKTTYNYGEELDLTGISASKVYRSGTEEPFEVTLDMVSGYDKNTLGAQTVTVTYNGLTATFEVSVVDYVSSIEVASNPTKTTYKYGEELDIAGLVVNQVYASGAKSQIEVSSEMVSGYDKNTLGTQTVTVTYNGLTATFEVSVVDYITGISLKTAPTKVEYEINEQLDVTGGVITVTKASGATEDVNITKEMVTGFNSSAASESLTLTVTYEGFTVTYNVTIKAAPVVDPGDEKPGEEEPGNTEEKKGCKGSIIATSAIISGLALVGVALVSLKKKED